MSRPLRIQYPGAFYHITSRGNARQRIFWTRQDRMEFLKILDQTRSRFTWRCHAYCLMGNHYHLLIETLEANLSRGMKHLNGVYTKWFNRKHRRVGHIFQGRYRGIHVEKGAHALELCRYVVLNPVRAGLRERPEEWVWSSYRHMFSRKKRTPQVTTDWILGQFSRDRAEALSRYRRFVAEGIGEEGEPWSRLVGQVYYGSEDFIRGLKKDELIEEIASEQQRPIRRPLAEMLKKGSPGEVLQAYRDEGYTLREIGAHLDVHYSTVSRRLKEAESACA